MLKDHVDFAALPQQIADYIAGKVPKPPTIATWRPAKAGDKCDGCGEPLPEGRLFQEAIADKSFGHTECHMGQPRGTLPFTVTKGKALSRMKKAPE